MTLVGAFSLGAAGQVMSGKLLRQSLGGAFRSGAAATIVGGALAGPPNSMGELTLVSNTQLTVQPARFVVPNALDATAGPYLVPNDAPVTLQAADGFPAQDASQYRRAIVAVYVEDAQIVGSGNNQPNLKIIGGPLAATAGAAVLGTLPANTSGLLLGELMIPPTGQAVTLTPYNPRTTTRGGILHLPTEAAANGIVTAGTPPLSRGSAFYAEDTKAYGFYDATANRIVWFDTQWQSYTPIMSNGAAPGVPWTTPGNAVINGRYFRAGRTIHCRGNVQLGSTTAYGGAGAGNINATYPTGYVPLQSTWQTGYSLIEPHGVGILNNQAGYAGLMAGLYPGTPANRRIEFWSHGAGTITVTAASGTYGLSSANHALSWDLTYETAFEA